MTGIKVFSELTNGYKPEFETLGVMIASNTNEHHPMEATQKYVTIYKDHVAETLICYWANSKADVNDDTVVSYAALDDKGQVYTSRWMIKYSDIKNILFGEVVEIFKDKEYDEHDMELLTTNK